MTVASRWHAATALVALVALGLQLVLVISGSAVLVESAPPPLPLRLLRFVAYFTIQSNVLVLLSTIPLVRDDDHDGRGWRVLRASAIAGIVITGVVHFFLLRPLLELEGWDRVADTLLHLVVPAMAVVGWLVFGPRPRMTREVALRTVAWPVAWFAVTMVVGGATGWFPYPFLDFTERGALAVAVTSLVVTGVFLTLLWLMLRYERVLGARR